MSISMWVQNIASAIAIIAAIVAILITRKAERSCKKAFLMNKPLNKKKELGK